VEENNIGFTITSFNELERIGRTVSDSDYKQYLSNISRLSDKVRNGYFLGTAIHQLVKEDAQRG
jgi:hypothetical protein